ncbi:MAG: tRNA epoxyqueuosine(34) reductase QueG [Bacteroidetes bacterium GWF2_43_63]|nr:MAG: tRNA epoxyqueuosine(34) reductase QueG [Bacteroidetes bacterium GWE2_42_42]OFY56486.1 MAG: tRNA epoxyqueuosine(34) reductase QueG [Bacteroidetes bacterium GWF2_43_63]
MTRNLKKDITDLLLRHGFSAVGFSPAGPVSQSWQGKFRQWLESGHHNGLQWLERNIEKRNDPTLLYPGTRTIISMLHPWPETQFDTGPLKIAAYAHGFDYHDYLRKQAEPAMQLIAAADPDFQPKFIADSAAVFDRYWAWKAGLGFIGRNGFLIQPTIGSRVLIAHIFTSLEFDSTAIPLENECGNCSKCVDSCPTQAFNGDGTIDARKCIACYNIESKEKLPEIIEQNNPGWIFGCDICQAACPYNQSHILSVGSQKMKGNWQVPADKKEWFEMSEVEFSSRFSHTPLKRAGLEKIKQTINSLSQRCTFLW